MSKRRSHKSKLPPHWEKVQSALWLLGLAFLFWRGDIFPGILVLVALSAIFQAAIMVYVKNQTTVQTQQAERERFLPEHCPNCGGPITPTTVTWRGPLTAVCPFCASTIKATAAPEPAKTTATG